MKRWAWPFVALALAVAMAWLWKMALVDGPPGLEDQPTSVQEASDPADSGPAVR